MEQYLSGTESNDASFMDSPQVQTRLEHNRLPEANSASSLVVTTNVYQASTEMAGTGDIDDVIQANYATALLGAVQSYQATYDLGLQTSPDSFPRQFAQLYDMREYKTSDLLEGFESTARKQEGFPEVRGASAVELSNADNANLVQSSDSSVPRKVKSLHICKVCGKLFKRAHNLKIHGRLHSGDQPYLCPHIKCEKRFRWKSSIVSHLKWHKTKRGESLHKGRYNFSIPPMVGERPQLPLSSNCASHDFENKMHVQSQDSSLQVRGTAYQNPSNLQEEAGEQDTEAAVIAPRVGACLYKNNQQDMPSTSIASGKNGKDEDVPLQRDDENRAKAEQYVELEILDFNFEDQQNFERPSQYAHGQVQVPDICSQHTTFPVTSGAHQSRYDFLGVNHCSSDYPEASACEVADVKFQQRNEHKLVPFTTWETIAPTDSFEYVVENYPLFS